jgi:glycolate oxidase FAD binding subunit
LSLPATAPPLGLAGDELIEWHGAERWLATALPAADVRAAAATVGGHATAFRARAKGAWSGAFAPLAPPLVAIHERLKRAFDPKGILNPGRLYPGL